MSTRIEYMCRLHQACGPENERPQPANAKCASPHLHNDLNSQPIPQHACLALRAKAERSGIIKSKCCVCQTMPSCWEPLTMNPTLDCYAPRSARRHATEELLPDLRVSCKETKACMIHIT